MAYDASKKAIVLFGGSTVDKQYGESSGETWEWDGERWTKIEIEQPPGIFNASMAYDKEENEIIRFGGYNGEARINETWSFKNNAWGPLALDNNPTPRNHSNMVYDEKRKRMILFGGHDGKNVFGDTWEFANRRWKNISIIEPLERQNNGH